MNKVLSSIACGLFLSYQSTSAALIDQDWSIPGDNHLLLDTSTGLQWLDLSQTANQSYADVSVNLAHGGIYEGFRFATQSEVLAMWGQAGITNTERQWVQNGEYAAVKDLVSRLGPTTMFEPGLFPIATHTVGMAEGGPVLPANERWAMELTYAPDGASTRTSASHYTWNVTSADEHYSSYLVRAVPLPAAVWLFISGGLMFTIMGLPRRRRT